jgi:hypothetical protein
MSTPIIETVSTKLLALINAVTTGNGYNETIQVKRQSRKDIADFVIQNANGFMIAGSRRLSDSQGSGKVTYEQSFMLMVFLINDDAASTPIDTRLNQVSSDVEKAILADPNLTGSAIWSDIESVEYMDDGEGTITFFEMIINVRYRTTRGNPYLV